MKINSQSNFSWTKSTMRTPINLEKLWRSQEVRRWPCREATSLRLAGDASQNSLGSQRSRHGRDWMWPSCPTTSMTTNSTRARSCKCPCLKDLAVLLDSWAASWQKRALASHQTFSPHKQRNRRTHRPSKVMSGQAMWRVAISTSILSAVRKSQMSQKEVRSSLPWRSRKRAALHTRAFTRARLQLQMRSGPLYCRRRRHWTLQTRTLASWLQTRQGPSSTQIGSLSYRRHQSNSRKWLRTTISYTTPSNSRRSWVRSRALTSVRSQSMGTRQRLRSCGTTWRNVPFSLRWANAKRMTRWTRASDFQQTLFD